MTALVWLVRYNKPMPELPEVETVRLGLHKLLPGKVVADVWSNWAKSFPNKPDDIKRHLIGAKIIAIRRRAKVIMIDLNTNFSLIVHLKLTGQLVYRGKKVHFGAGHPSDSLVGELPDNTTHVMLTLADHGKLFFNDQRKFGWMRLVPTGEIDELPFFKKLGPEPLESSFTAKAFIDRIRRRVRTGIKATLMDQGVIAGVGNIYADESLFAAKIHPATPVGHLSDGQLLLLYKKLREVLRLAIKKGGSTDKNYVDAQGRKGSYLSFAKVFRREGHPCPRCHTTIIKLRVAGRGTHICPYCQRLD